MPKSTEPMNDVVLRKQKNASAQAAFRARRANYIATLEETVTSLESVVIQLQESCRDARTEAVELRQDNARLRMEFRERERFWRALWQTRKTGQAPDPDDLPPPPLASPYLGHTQSDGLPLMHQHSYGNGLAYREDAVLCQSTYNPNFASSSPAVPPFANSDVSADGSSGRVGKYAPYHFHINGASRDPRWHAMPAGLPNGESGTPHSQSPSITSTDISSYSARISAGEEQKAALNSVLDNAPYVFPNGDRFPQNAGDSVPNSRSMSPTTQSTPNSSTSMSLTSSFPFTFHEPPTSVGQERSEFDYRRHSLPHCPEMTLHGGTADVTLTGQATHDAVRYRMGDRRPESGADYQPILSAHENPPSQDHNSSDGDQSLTDPRSRSRRHTLPSHSRSPSPGPTPISCTVAVIKAQAFGALRRTRAKTKKTAEGAAKVAMDVLEARGIGVGGSAGTKRQRLDDDDVNTGTP